MSDIKFLHDTFLEVLQAVEPSKLVQKSLAYENGALHIQNKSFPIKGKVTLLGSGKAVIPMADAIHTILKDTIKESVLVGQSEYDLELNNTTYIQSTHPIPSESSIKGAKTIIKTLESLNEDDFFIYLLSGGNSSLVELPSDSISLDEFQETTNLMLTNGMPIEAINSVRKHISQVKGGNLVKFTKAKGIVLVLSDVLGNDINAIGSAPLYFDSTSYDDAIKYLHKYNIWEQTPKSVQNVLLDKKDETPKMESKNIKHFLIGSNEIVLKSANSILAKNGIETYLFEQSIFKDVQETAKIFESLIEKYKDKSCALLLGGEATVMVKKNGKGGRNQHLALLMVDILEKYPNITLLSSATDGRDGNSMASGAIIDSTTKNEAQKLGIDTKTFLDNFDSNSFFKITNNLIETGLTNNNLLDIVIILINNKEGE